MKGSKHLLVAEIIRPIIIGEKHPDNDEILTNPKLWWAKVGNKEVLICGDDDYLKRENLEAERYILNRPRF
jgi:hypothetical protein